MLLDGEPGPGGLSAASPQSQAGGRGPRPPSGGMGRGAVKRAQRTRQNPRGSKALRDDDKAWVTRTEPQDHRGGSDLCSLEHPPGGHLSPAWSRTQTATGSQEDSV